MTGDGLPTTKKEFEIIKNALPNKYTDNSVTIHGKDPWVEGGKIAEKQMNEIF